MESYIQRDAPDEVRKHLRSASVIPEGVKVRDRLADGWTIHDGLQVTVGGAGTPRAGRATSLENVHVAVYSRYRPEARALAARIDAYLLNPSIALGFSISPGPGLSCVPDDDTGGWVCSVTVVAGAPKEGVIFS